MRLNKVRGGFVSWESVDLRLGAARSIWLATTRPDGRPHTVPVWFLWDGGTVHFTADPGSQKGANLSSQSWTVLHLGDGDDVIILEGRCGVVTDQDAVRHVETRYGAKYIEPVKGVSARVPTGWAVYKVDVERVIAWSYGNMASRTDWTIQTVIAEGRGRPLPR
jgi:PPOX class probable F420-dependent enzyme